jgi:hypothetical protein
MLSYTVSFARRPSKSWDDGGTGKRLAMQAMLQAEVETDASRAKPKHRFITSRVIG